MLGLRLDAATEAGLSRIARQEGRTKSAIVREALRGYLSTVDDDAAMIAQVRAVSALSMEEDLNLLDAAQADLEDLLNDEETGYHASKAA